MHRFVKDGGILCLAAERGTVDAARRNFPGQRFIGGFAALPFVIYGIGKAQSDGIFRGVYRRYRACFRIETGRRTAYGRYHDDGLRRVFAAVGRNIEVFERDMLFGTGIIVIARRELGDRELFFGDHKFGDRVVGILRPVCRGGGIVCRFFRDSHGAIGARIRCRRRHGNFLP